MSVAEDFLDLYKQLEEELEDKYTNARRRFSSVIYEFIKSSESEPVRDKLEVCREIRNLLSHNAKLGGEPIVSPSEPVVQALKEVIDFVRKPPLAIEYATKAESIIKATLDQKVLKVMRVMEKNGISHVPVLENGHFTGVFSIETVFQYILNAGKAISENTTVRDLSQHIPVHMHRDNYYAFIPENASFIQAKDHFKKKFGRNERTAVVFITKTGKQDEKLLGMITPFDVMEEQVKK